MAAIELIAKIKPKNNETFPLVDACDIEMPNGERLDKAMETEISSIIPEDGIVKVGVLYFLGEITELNVGFPNEANQGDMIYISFQSGDTATNVNILTQNYLGLTRFSAERNITYELMGIWNGSIWMMVGSGVS